MAVHHGWQPDLCRLEQLADLRQLSSADYRESWLWVRFCLHQSPATRKALLDHIAALRREQADSLADRLAKIVPGSPQAVCRHLESLPRGSSFSSKSHEGGAGCQRGESRP